MHHRQVTPVAGGMKGGRSLRDVLPHDGRVADLAITKAQFVVCEADCAGVVGALRLRQRLDEKRDASRGLATS